MRRAKRSEKSPEKKPRASGPAGKKANPSFQVPVPALKALGSWFGRQKRVLPWRDDPSLYRVWVSEIMLQQTQVVTVVPYFERFLRAFPTVDALAACTEDEVMKEWAGLGYYSRARNLRKGAQAIVARRKIQGDSAKIDARARPVGAKPGAAGDEFTRSLDGFPRTREEWLEIPGVGEYTAGAILSIALNLPEAIVDGNVERVFARLMRLSRRALGETPYKQELWRLARESVVDANRVKVLPSVLNQSLMELGAIVCTPKKPSCLLCPVREHCGAYAAGEVEVFPEKKKPKDWIAIQESRVAVLSADGARVLMEKAASGAWRAGLWDLLGEGSFGKKSAGEELGVVESKHVVTRHKISRSTRVLRLKKNEKADGFRIPAHSSPAKRPAGLDDSLGGELRWVSLVDPEVAIGSAPKKVLSMIRERFF